MPEFSFDLTVDREHFHDAVKGLLCTIFFYRTFGPIVPKSYEFLEVPYQFVDVPELEEAIESKIDMILTKLDQENDTPIMSSTSSTPLGSPPNLKYINPSISDNPYANLRIADQTIDEEPEQNRANSVGSLDHSFPGGSIHSSLISPTLKPTVTVNTQNNVKLITIIINFKDTKKLKKPTWFGKIEEQITFESWYLNLKVLNRSTYSPSESDNFVKILQKHFESLVWQISDTANLNKSHIPDITTVDLLPFIYTISIKKSASNESWKEFITKILKDPII